MNWRELTLRDQVTFIVLAGLVVLTIIAITIDVIQIHSVHAAEIKNRGFRMLGEALPELADAEPDERDALVAGLINSERSVLVSDRDMAMETEDTEDHSSEATWIFDHLVSRGVPVAEISVVDRHIYTEPNGTLSEFGDLAGIGDLQPASDAPRRPVITIYSVRLADSDVWYNFYILMAPREFWKVLLRRSVDSFVGIGLMIVLYYLIGRVMRPFGTLAANAERLGRGETTDELEPTGSVDVRSTIVAFNRMEARIEQSFDYQTALLRSFGHDLTGPLNRLNRTIEQVEPVKTREQMQKRLQSVDDIVQSISSFARETRRDGSVSKIDLGSLLEALVEEQTEVGHVATLSMGADPVVRGRYNALTRAFRNLIENAVKYGNAAHVSAEVQDGSVVIHVDDEGPGIDADQLEAAFEPFQRLGHRGPGTGLGLAIVRAILVDHGGSAQLANRDGGGLRATLRLPIEAED